MNFYTKNIGDIQMIKTYRSGDVNYINGGKK